MKNNIIIKKYSESAFNIAKKLNIIDEFYSDLENFFYSLSDDFIRLFKNPTISKSILRDIIIKICKKLKIRKEIENFILILSESRRLSLINDILDSFLKLKKEHNNILIADLYIADDISDNHLNEIKSILEKKYKNKIIEINKIIKKSILGGVMIKINSELIDSSLRSRLSNLRKELESVII